MTTYDIANLVDGEAFFDANRQAAPQRQQASARTRRLFAVLQGGYGNLFLSKFNSGELNSDGTDKGMRTALLVWDGELAQFPDAVIEAAALRIQRESPEFPPNLPQFVRLCEAIAPRKTWIEEQGLKRLPPPNVIPPEPVSFEEKRDGKDWARRILARVQSGDKSVRRYAHQCAREALGLEGRMSWQ